MNKAEILEIIKQAKEEIDSMLEEAKMLSEGLDLPYEPIALDPKESAFGKWFYTQGQKLQSLSNNPMECLVNISLLLNDFYKSYHDIIAGYSKGHTKILSKLFGKKDGASKEDLAQHFKRLVHSHQKFKAELTKMERRIGATPQEKLSAL